MVENDREKLAELLGRHDWWYHRMDLGTGITTPGHYGNNLLPVASLLKHLDLEGFSCLDIGTMDGKMAFLLEKLGGDVVTVDVFKRETVTDLIDHFSSSVTYVPGIRDSNLTDLKNSFGWFDFVLCAGVLYHIYSPFDFIASVRKLIKTNGLALFETAAIRDEKKSYMQLNRGDLYDEHTTIWVPSIACLKNMLRYFGFEIIGDVILKEKVIRYAVLCKAVAPSVIGKSTTDPWYAALLLKNLPGISSEYLLPQLDIDEFENAPDSAISMLSEPKERRVLSLRRPGKHTEESELLDRATPKRD